MKRFRYRFESILSAKRHVEETRQRALGEAIRAVVGQQKLLSQIDRQRQAQLTAQREHLVGTLSPARELVASRFHVRLKQQRQATLEMIRKLEGIVEQRRAELLAASRERKVQEKLKERQTEDWRREMDRHEQLEMDEIAMQQFRNEQKVRSAI